MAKYIKYLYDDFEGGYIREGYWEAYNSGSIQAHLSGRMFAHDFVEHPLGHPTGTLEDEIAAFGCITVTRLPAGLIRGGWHCPVEVLAEELRDMLDSYRFGVPDEDMLKPRRTYFPDLSCYAREVAEQVTENKVLQRRLCAWLQHGITKSRRRFGCDIRTLTIFQEIERVTDDLLKEGNPYQFTLRIEEDYVSIPEHLIKW